MNRTSLLLRIAGVLTLFTCLGHTVGTFMPIPAEQAEVAKTAAIMKTTVVPMPVGRAQNYGSLFLGTNLTVSLYLLLAGIGFFMFAAQGGLNGAGRSQLVLLSVGMAGLAVISALYFFPLPAACTGLAAILGFIAVKSN